MNTRTVVAALAAVSMFACGPQNVVEDTDGIAASDSATSQDEVKSKAPPPKTPPPPPAIAMKVQTAAAQPGPFATTYSINATYDLFFAFDMPSSKSGSHTARYEISAPSGLYQVNDVSFAAGIAAVGDQVQADVISGGYRVWSSMPVAGTMVEQYHMTGRWTVKVFLDGSNVASSTYTLNN